MLSKNFEYGYLILKKLEKGDMLSGREILKDIKVPKSMGLRILTKLSGSGLITSAKGKDGGFFINKREITFLDLFIALELSDTSLGMLAIYEDCEIIETEYYKKKIEVGHAIVKKLSQIKI